MDCNSLCIFSGPKVETVTHGTLYKFALLKKYIIRSSWEIGHNSFLENPISIRLVALEGGQRGLPQVTILDLGDPNLHRYNRFKIEILKARKRITQIKKIETPSNQNWMDDLKNAIEANINSFIYSMEVDIDGMETY